MRPENKYLVEEVGHHLAKSDYVFLANYQRATVEDIAALRASLVEHDAEFHVVKNSIFNVAARERSLPDLSEHLTGQTAIIVGGSNPSGVAKAVDKFFRDKENVELKGGVLGAKTLSREQIETLAQLPGLESLRQQLLGLFNQPGTSLVRVLNGVPQALLNVLQARVDKEKGE